MKKNILALTILIFGLNSFGQVFIKFNNQTDKQISIKITAGEQNSPIESFLEVYSTTIQANAQQQDFIKIKEIKKGYKIIVTGAMATLGNFKFYEQTISQKNSKLTILLTLAVEEVPSDNTSYQNLLNALNYNPPKGSNKVMSSDIAFKSFFGGLCLRKDTIDLDRLEPSVLKSEMNPIQYGSINRSISTYFSGNFLSDNKAGAPGIANVSGSVQRDELYKLTYDVNDIGTLVWSPPNGKSIGQLFNELNEIDKIGWVKRYIADSTLKMFQYDHIYLFKTMDVFVDKYKRTSTTVDANVPIFFSSNTAFKKDEGGSFKVNATTTALNIWSEKDITYLLVQTAQAYLEKQKAIIQQTTTNKDAQNVINSTFKFDDTNIIATNEKSTKSDILNNLNNRIKILKTKSNEKTEDK